ncbi:MAG TPA: oligoendopeptidase F [Clostridiales bacterium]|nr:oligoendopeptidase F [Clostridiales bacterium]HPP36068.1 oligoendopeptidase F [Clostridiales bacterium]
MTTKKLPARDEIDPKYKWRLEDIYSSEDDWEADFKKVQQLSGKISSYKGRLAGSMEALLECLELRDELSALTEKVFAYARMRRDENNAEPKYQALTDRAVMLMTEVNASTSFIVPEIISIDEELLRKSIDEMEGLSLYRHFFDDILRQKKHVLSDKEEELLALADEVMDSPSEIFSMFNDADIKFGTIRDENGEEVEVTKGRYIKFLESKDRRVRKDAFHTLYDSYRAMRNTLAASLGSNIKRDKFFANVRRYGSSLQAALDSDNVPVDVYDNLIDTVNRNLPLLHRYVRLRKKALKLDELHMYDLYVPIVEQPTRHISYEEALETVKNGLAALGCCYVEDMTKAFGSGWIDVYENQGKTSGAYSWGTYLTHPYILLNYQGTINDVFTIAHEMGHAMHSYYTNKTQPYIYSDYRIFVAEVASTVNESLLMDYLLSVTTDKNERAYLMNHYLEEFRGTLFRQTMFAEFEKITHEMIEKGEALNADGFCRIYRGLNEKYFGAEVVIDDDIDMEWARIPHFYRSFYVYKYATGISAAVSLSRQIIGDGVPAIDRYLEFLKSGGSDYPLELLKKAGVDLTVPKPVEDALKTFEKVLNDLEEIIG